MPHDPQTIEAMKLWLSDGEWDVNLMILTGAMSTEQLVQTCEVLTDSPWFKQPD